MATRYYRKDIPEMPVYISGTPLKFEVLATADALLIGELDKCIQHGRGGVIAISEEEYNETVKKNTSETISESVYKQKQQRQELSALQIQQSLAAGGAVRIESAFSQLPTREATPHNQFGLPQSAFGPSEAKNKPMPDPIDVPSTKDLRPTTVPTTVKLSELRSAAK